MKPTPKQAKAISFDTGKCLVAAGAGSGKTKVLTSRIFDLVVTNKAKLSELLVLTFTNKAAHEMKMRVRDLFNENEATRKFIPEVEVAKIMTFDAFALDLVKKYRFQLGLDKGIDLLDQAFFDIKTHEILDEVLTAYYENALAGLDPVFTKLCRSFDIKEDGKFKDFILAIIALADKKSDCEAFLKYGYGEYLDQSFFEKTIKELEEKIRSDYRTYYDGISLIDDGNLAKDYQRIDEALATSCWDELCDVMKPNFPSARGLDEDTKHQRDYLKNKYIASTKDFLKHKKDEYLQPILNSRKYVDKAMAIAYEVYSRLQTWKKEKGVYSLSDIALLAKQIVNGKYGEEVKQGFKYVMIDEYQDTNDLQEDFVTAMGVDNVFMVGDIKQSIYGFRNANPKLFAQKFADYGKGKDGTLITLDDNFRSRSQVLDSINDVFSSIMSEEVGGIDYKNGQALAFGNKGYDLTKDAAPYGYEVIDYVRRQYKNDEHVGVLMGRDILHKIKSHYQVANGQSTRDITFGDFAILTRNTKVLHTYERVLRTFNIPVDIAADHNGFDEDVMVALSILIQWVALELQDEPNLNRVKHFEVALKRSFLLNQTDEDIRKELDGGDASLRERVRKFAFEHKNDPLPALVKEATVEFGFTKALLRLGQVKDNFDLLSYFLKFASQASSLGMDLDEFALFLKKRAELKVKFDVSPSASGGNAVQLMTMHKSKGLEFPFVYFPRLNSKFNNSNSDGKAGFYASMDYGIIIPDLDNGGPSLYKELNNRQSKKDALSEELRVLYVALTRPKESYAVMVPINEEGAMPNPPKTISSTQNHLQFLLCTSFFEVNHRDGESLSFIETSSNAAITNKEIEFKTPLPEIDNNVIPTSKSAWEPSASEGALRHGLRLHRYMEVVDLSTHDLSFISNHHDKAVIAKVLSLPLFLDNGKRTAYREFEFVDEEGKNGRIDLFFVYEDKIQVIDYKSASTDNPEYIEQVNRYCSFLEGIYGLPCEGYLLSLSEARLNKVR